MQNLAIGFFLIGLSFYANADTVTDLIKKNQLEEAHTIIEFEIAKNPKIPSTWLDYAKLMLAKNDSEKSWAGLMQAQKLIKTTIFSQEALNSYESEFYQTEGAWYFQKKYFDKAAQSFNRALKFQKNNNQAHLGVIFSLLAGNKVQEVKPLVLSMQENLPKNELVHYLYQATLASEKSLQELIKLHPALMGPRIGLADFYIKKGQYAAAKKIIDGLQKDDATKLPFLLLSSEIFLYLKQPEEAIKQLNPLLPLHEDYRLRALLSVAYAKLGKYDQANIFFEKALKAKESKEADILSFGFPQIESHNLAYIDKLMVNTYYQNQLSLMPSELVKVIYFFKKNQMSEAKQEARKWLQLYPRQAFSYDVLGSINKTEGDYHSAETAFQSAIKLDENYLPARLHLTELLTKQKKYQEARKLLLDISKKFKPDSKIFLLWSKLEEFEGNRDAAKKWLEKALSVEQNIEPGLEFVSFYLRQNRPNLALMLAENLAKVHGNDIRLLNLLGGLYLENTKDYQQAIKIYEKLAWYQPDSSGAAQNLSKGYQLAGRAEMAVTVLETHWHHYPEHIDIARQLARLYVYHKNFDKAKLVFEKILKDHPEDYVSLNNLASLYIETEAKKSLSFAKQAYEVASNNPSVCDTLGWSYYKNGDSKKALIYLSKSNELDKNLADAAYHLAIVHQELGQKKVAVTYLKQALASVDPQFTARTQASILLKNWSI